MLRRKGFSIIEFLVVVLIVGILAAILIPTMRGRRDQAKWAEGRATAEMLAGALKGYAVKNGNDGTYGEGQPSLSAMDYSAGNLTGKYFDYTNFTWTTSYDDEREPKLKYTITVSAPKGVLRPSGMAMDDTGQWTSIP